MTPRIRPATEDDAPAIARVHVDTWRTAYRGIVDGAYLRSLSYPDFEKRRRQRLATPGTITFVAEVRGKVVGFATAGPNRDLDTEYDTELYAIYIRKAFARKGLGSALVAAVARGLSDAGHRAMVLWVLRDNAPSRRFYESLGGTLAGEKSSRFGSQDLPHAGYGWPDVAALATRLRRLGVALPDVPAQNAPATRTTTPKGDRMVTANVLEAVNEQINNELVSSYTYLAMSAQCTMQHFHGFAKWLRIQSQEEYGHAMKLLDFLLNRGGGAKLNAIPEPKVKFKTMQEVFEAALKQELEVSRRIDSLYELAQKEKAFALMVELQWFLTEQVEEEKQARDIVAKFNLIKNDPVALLEMDRDLGSRGPEKG